jgi:hypothetical protein
LAILADPFTIREVHPKKKRFTLAEMYQLIGCDCVQMIGLADGRTMWMDEEAKLRDGPKRVNLLCDRLADACGRTAGGFRCGQRVDLQA